MINQAPIVRYTASVSENFFPNSWRKTFSAESVLILLKNLPFILLILRESQDERRSG